MQNLRLAFLLVLTGILTITTAHAQNTKTFHTSAGAEISYDEFGAPAAPSCLILLHGASGLSLGLYKDQAIYFASQGFRVWMPHYFDATRTTKPTTENYHAWSTLVKELAEECRKQPTTKHVFLVGYSLGASVALAAGSEGAPIDAIADWYGSLPDDFFNHIKAMPPLLILHGEHDSTIPILNAQQLVQLCDMRELTCDHHFYPDQQHGFEGKALQDADQRTIAFFRQQH